MMSFMLLKVVDTYNAGNTTHLVIEASYEFSKTDIISAVSNFLSDKEVNATVTDIEEISKQDGVVTYDVSLYNPRLVNIKVKNLVDYVY